MFQWIGLRENLQENLGKTMVSCRFPLNQSIECSNFAVNPSTPLTLLLWYTADALDFSCNEALGWWFQQCCSACMLVEAWQDELWSCKWDTKKSEELLVFFVRHLMKMLLFYWLLNPRFTIFKCWLYFFVSSQIYRWHVFFGRWRGRVALVSWYRLRWLNPAAIWDGWKPIDNGIN